MRAECWCIDQHSAAFEILLLKAVGDGQNLYQGLTETLSEIGIRVPEYLGAATIPSAWAKLRQ